MSITAPVLDETSARRSRPGAAGASTRLLRVSAGALVISALASALLFGLYILAFYAGAVADGQMERWNSVLPRLYEADTPLATFGIAAHFAAGGLILVLGGIQLVTPLRHRYPAFHRWTGRVYVAAALIAGLGGLTFIAVKGTIGGTVMDVGFSLYGVLTVVAAVETYRHARARRLDQHRAWALRLFALAIGSWLYRMDYGFWMMLTGGLGHEPGFRGPFDMVMAFFFYLPNLAVAELFIRGRSPGVSPATRVGISALLLAVTGFLLLGTYYFTTIYWGPAILDRLRG